MPSAELQEYVDVMLANKIRRALLALQKSLKRRLEAKEAQAVARQVSDDWARAMHDAGLGELVGVRVIKISSMKDLPCVLGGGQHCLHYPRMACCMCKADAAQPQQLN